MVSSVRSEGEKGRRLKSAAAPATVRADADAAGLNAPPQKSLIPPQRFYARSLAAKGREDAPEKQPEPGDLPADALIYL